MIKTACKQSLTMGVVNPYSLSVQVFLAWLLCLMAAPAFTQAASPDGPLQIQSIRLDQQKIDKEQPYFLSPTLYYQLDTDDNFDAQELIQQVELGKPLEQQGWQHSGDDYATVGNTALPVWFYISIYSGDIELRGSYFEAHHAQLSNATAYIFRDYQLIDTITFSDAQTFSSREISQAAIVFPFDIDAQQHYQLLFRVKSTVVVDFPLYLHSPASLLKTFSDRNREYGIYYGMVIIMVLYNLFIFLSTRDIAYLGYICFVSCVALTLATIDGTAYQYVWPNYPQINPIAVSLFASLSVLFGAIFTTTFLGIWKKPGLQKYYYNALMLIAVISVILSLTLQANSSLEVTSILALLAYPSFLITGILSWRQGHVYARYFTIAWALLCTFSIMLSFAATGIGDFAVENTWILVRYGSGIEMVLLSLALAAKINEIKSNEKQARDESAAKSDFIAQLSHELRTPMNGILGMSQLLTDRLEDKTSQHYNKVIYQSGLALLGVINDVLDAAKIDAEKLEIESICFNLHTLAHESLQIIEAQALKKSIPVHCHIDKTIPQWVTGDPHRIKQVLLNFFSNAIKFTEKGTIELSLMPGNEVDTVLLSVSDTGLGIPEDKLKDLFQPYSQVSSSTARQYGGTGLGLYICQRLTKMMHGEIKASCKSTGGSIFSIVLPLPPCPAEQTNKPLQGVKSYQEQLNILVAEDNAVNQIVIKRMLEKLGHQVEMAADGKQAMDLAIEQPFHLILMDCEMPVMNGYEATVKIIEHQQREKLPLTPIVAVTAHALKSYHDKALGSGMVGRITKPIKIDTLEETIALYAQSTHIEES